nr:hypothetical protein [Mycobacterium sp. Root135]
MSGQRQPCRDGGAGRGTQTLLVVVGDLVLAGGLLPEDAGADAGVGDPGARVGDESFGQVVDAGVDDPLRAELPAVGGRARDDVQPGLLGDLP